MAAVHSWRPASPTPSTAGRRQTSAADRPKLRHSCHACASSKLKCSQNKPTCSRCAKRGLTCEYFAAKPGGRKPNKQSSNDNHQNGVPNTTANFSNNEHLSAQVNRLPSSSSDPTIDLPSSGILHQSPRTTISDTSMDLFDPIDQGLSSISTAACNDLDDLCNSSISSSMEASNVDLFKLADFFPAGIENNINDPENLSDACPVFENAISELLALSAPSSTSKIPTAPSNEVQEYQSFPAMEPACSCLLRALGFMKQLFPSPFSSDCMTRATQGLDKATITPTIQAAITRNEATVQAVDAMLNCASCSQDGYLLAVMSLIIFRVLGWYEAVARQTPGLHGSPPCRQRESSPPGLVLENPVVVGSYRLDGDDSARMSAQLVLNELHRVRNLINKLSSKLKMQASKSRGGGAESPESMDSDNGMMLPLSAVMYNQFDADLKRRLKALSCEMIDRLRRL